MSTSTPIGPLLQTVFESILEVFLLCLAGYILARKGILDRKIQKALNRLNVSLFTPSLLFSKVAFFLSPAKLRELWIVPVFFVITTAVSMIVAYLFGVLLRLKKSQRSFAVAASMFMNSNSLPIALMQSLVITVPGLKWGDDDNADAMVGRALTYLVLYSTLGMILRWSYGVRLLSAADPEVVLEEPRQDETESLLHAEEPAFPVSTEEQRALQHAVSSTSVNTDDSKTAASVRGNPNVTVEDVDKPGSNNKVFYSFPNSRHHTPQGSASTSGYTSERDDDDELPMRNTNPTEPSSSLWQSRVRRVRHRIATFWHRFNDFMTAPLWAALASLIVACIQPLQHALEEHVQPIKGAISAAGNCSIPLTLVVLGAYFYSPDEEEDRSRRALPHHRHPRSRSLSTTSRMSLFENVCEMFKMRRRDRSVKRKNDSARPGETKTVIVAVLSRMVITPLLLLPLMMLSTRFDVQEVFDDPVFVVSNVLLIASPPALTLAQITQAASGDAFERLISRTIFWSYCVVTPPSTIIFVVVGLLVTKL
ncbi:hypothetical protein CERSUDRAFT_116395 [Gelatoporia subvermispora B]|uniref:Auxin efflux carrier n=1 Tax=Ceriporiopsis subvermispora (strain B) TaxID=914234 RepID=M2PHT3_CERS8|nr:hypothetical protein CERSUDRAFT_116395 [Gelatoporia subvermispora B]